MVSGRKALLFVIAIVVGGEESEGLHELVTLGDGDVAVVELFGRLAIDVKPPVTLQDRLVEKGRLRTQEALHDQPIVREGAHMKYLEKLNMSF